ncbi:MAG: bifunctional molybdenum cofactor biosynthesis protein MoaC/MoaB [Bacteroidetes bacterium]|nr:bifunctional molybdenum cofactor biosynthesis protein MoaC/MoaB [Bacteroidota bacterium]
MVDITHKQTTLRQALAVATLRVSSQETIDAILERRVPKGDVFEFSRAAGLLACKRTYEAIPDCHPLPVEFTAITHAVSGLEITVRVEVHTVYKTGVEVEAMHGAAITALTMYDMLKPIDGGLEIGSIRLEEKKGGKGDVKHAYPANLRTAVVTCSDSVSKGLHADTSGDVIEEKLRSHGLPHIERTAIPDDFTTIQQTAAKLIADGCQLIVFTGGTGLSERDVTPDAIRPLLERELPGVMEAARGYGQQRTPYAMLSRGVAGFSGSTLLLTLPGSPRGAAESMEALFPYILHVFRVKEGVRHD